MGTACPVCCGFHKGAASCPGELPASGPERHGWRVEVETPRGIEAIGVLVAPSLDVWRARILTFPNVLWGAPGVAGTLKFVGATPQEAERKAVEYVEAHCGRVGWTRRNGLAPVEAGRFTAEAVRAPGTRAALRHGRRVAKPATSLSFPRSPQQSKRKLRVLPIRFGIERPSTLGQTINVSREGMCIATASPLDAGEAIRLHFDVQQFTLALHGFVVWQRPRPEPGRPMGMGLRLVEPPEIYTGFVASLS